MAEGKRRRMMILSFDAMGARDLEYMKKKPYFGRFLKEAARCENVKSVYPSITYPAHATIVTGRLPKNHGVVNNTLIQPQWDYPDWMWQRKYIRGKTLYDEAIRQGMSTAALLWPVTAKSRIRYNVPEIVAFRPWQNQIVLSALNGRLFYQLELLKLYGGVVDGVKQPALDNFVQKSLLHTIRKYRPELILTHFTDLDTTRHSYGLDNEHTRAAMDRHDERLGQILRTMEEEGLYEDTVTVILGDHCQMDVKTVVYPNYFFEKAGFLTVKRGRIRSYKALAKNCDGSCYIYVKDKRLLPAVRRLLSGMQERGRYGIEKILTGSEAGALGADPDCAFMLEAAQGYYFLDGHDCPAEPVEQAEKHRMFATHGYLPDKPDYATFFAMRGPGVEAGAVRDRMSLEDEGPTLARILGVDLGKTDGRAVEEFLAPTPTKRPAPAACNSQG